MTDLEIEPFELDITDEVKHLHDEHRRLAGSHRGSAFAAEEAAAEARRLGFESSMLDDLGFASEEHERADLHEHTANVFAIILGLASEDD